MHISVKGSSYDFTDYPVYDVQVSLSDGGATVGFHVTNINAGLGDVVTGNSCTGIFDTAVLESSFLAAIKTWAEGADWSSFDYGTYSGITITRFDQGQTDVTPS